MYFYATAALSVFTLQIGSYFSSMYTVHAQRQIDREAVKVRPHLGVSRTLLFSSPEMQEQFHIWMDQFEAVRWQPRLVLGIYISNAFWFPISKLECGRWGPFLAYVSEAVLPAARVALEMRGGAKQDQSLCSALAIGYLYAVAFIFLVLNDPCFLGAGPGGTSLAGTASFAASTTLVGHCITPCTMQHLTELCWTIGVGIVAILYAQYLQQNGGLDVWKSDPNFLGLLALVFGMAIATLVVYSTRVFLAKNLMVAFLESIRRNR